jgi:Haem-binding domain
MARTTRRRRRSWKKTLLWTFAIAVVGFLLIQLVPYGRASHTDPPATNPFKWSDPQAAALARAACYDCHSNKTKWWWATNIAPMSWLVQKDVDEARGIANFSQYAGVPSTEEFRRAVTGNMPPLQYTLLHPNAELSDAEKQTLIAGYERSLAANGGGAPGGQPSAAPPAASAADGAALVQSRCGTCHQAPTSYHAGSAEEARALVENMVQRGASASAAEEQALIAYFTR